MKKQFFYAALAIGMMSSCTSSDLPGNQAPEEQLPEEERVAIELGISSPNAKIEASTKGIGSVGGINDEENKWNGEELGIWMYKVTTDEQGTRETLAPENESVSTYIFEGLTFKAPTGTDEGKIEMIKETTPTTIYQVKYYPSKGAYSFYGYHLGGATGTENRNAKTISAITIDGTNDIMAAGTLAVTQGNYSAVAHEPGAAPGTTLSDSWETIAKQSFSAWSARRGIQPTLVFEHKLARLRFFVKAGDETASTHKWNGSSEWIPRDVVPVSDGASGTVDVTQAVQITSIKVNELAEKVDMTLEKGPDGKIVALTANADAERTTPFTLMRRAAVGQNLVPLEPVAAKCWNDPTQGATTGTGYEEKSQVGESIMFLPEEGTTDSKLNIEIGVSQAVLDTYEKDDSGNETNKKYIVKNDILKTILDAANITGGTSTAKFEAGKNYDIIITVYSYSRIEITAQLTAWGNGGSINVAPGDEF